MVATFHGNPNTTIISCYSPTNVSEELQVEQFYMEFASLTISANTAYTYFETGCKESSAKYIPLKLKTMKSVKNTKIYI